MVCLLVEPYFPFKRKDMVISEVLLSAWRSHVSNTKDATSLIRNIASEASGIYRHLARTYNQALQQYLDNSPVIEVALDFKAHAELVCLLFSQKIAKRPEIVRIVFEPATNLPYYNK